MNLTSDSSPPHDSPSDLPLEAPLQIELVFRLHVPADEAFELVSTRLTEWFAKIHDVRWQSPRTSPGPAGPGGCTERVCAFDGKDLVETIVAWSPGRSYAYAVDMNRSAMKMPLARHLGTFDVVDEGSNLSRVTWRQHFVPRWFVPGGLLRWQMRDKMMRPAVEALLATRGGEWISSR